jgi:hypothetical protein
MVRKPVTFMEEWQFSMALTVSTTAKLTTVVCGVPSTVTGIEVSRPIGISGPTEELSLIRLYLVWESFMEVSGGRIVWDPAQKPFYPGGWCSGSGLDLYSGGSWFESRPNAIYPDYVYCGFSQSFQSNAGIPPLGHDRFIPNPFQFIGHQSSYHLTQ